MEKGGDDDDDDEDDKEDEDQYRPYKLPPLRVTEALILECEKK